MIISKKLFLKLVKLKTFLVFNYFILILNIQLEKNYNFENNYMVNIYDRNKYIILGPV